MKIRNNYETQSKVPFTDAIHLEEEEIISHFYEIYTIHYYTDDIKIILKAELEIKFLNDHRQHLNNVLR